MLIAPSMLSADFGKLSEEIDKLNNTDCNYLHIDIMDGYFVPNMTFGKGIVESIAKQSKKPLDIHLMVKNTEFFINMFLDIKPEFLSIHIEEEIHINRMINLIQSHNIKAGIVLNPHTPPQSIEYIIEYVDLVLLMSVNPGFGGQSFIPNVLQKAYIVKKMINDKNPNCLLEIDGGINNKNINIVKKAFIDIVVSGNYIFSSKNYQKAIDSLR
ncbi:ribulose-phosphate 3-epimerase [Helicobacter sp. MIT 14-3879]|uniref:ribulose-phosphate 3-epimerase n=1 Tax=Helicobacter sp. MIT 14-3879 TaxID=2040649 RepID=UPI000E1ED297|nr:ribulose-phosphate 3-epimerase [Helicobacter sp. MIT 14-3879]RDU61641.1 ribulose-phosphate 3-epimerase [Helicobacter sp. MIT 14-3879]